LKHAPLASVVAILESGARPKGGIQDIDEGVPSLGGEHVNAAGGFNFASLKLVPIEFYRAMEKGRIARDDILIVKDGATTGKVAIVRATFPHEAASINEHVFRVVVDNTKADPLYVFHFLFSAMGQGEILKDFRGATVGGISRGFVDRAVIPLPPLAEQKRIAAVLDKADALRTKRRQSLATLDSLLQSVFLDMFGDPVTNPKGWPIVTVESLLAQGDSRIRTGPFGSQLLHSEFVSEGVPVLGIENVVTNEFRWTEPRCLPQNKYRNFTRYRVFPGDVLITIMGTVGRVCVAPDDLPECMSTKHLCVLTLDHSKVMPSYVWAALLHDSSVRSQMRMAGKGAIMEGWNSTTIRNLRVKLPPVSLQREFAQVCEGFRRTNGTLLKHRETADTLFASLQSAAFAGTLFNGDIANAAASKSVRPNSGTDQGGIAMVVGSS
jgi:type I restriction enzyme S subunit